MTSGALQRPGHDDRWNSVVHDVGAATPVSWSGCKTNGEAWENHELTTVLAKVMVGAKEGGAMLAMYERVVRRHSECGTSTSACH